MKVQETIQKILSTSKKGKYYQVFVRNYNPSTDEASGIYVMEDAVINKAKIKRMVKKLELKDVIYNE